MKKSFLSALIAPLVVAALPAAATGILPAPAPVPVSAPAATNWTGGYVGGALAYLDSSALYCDDFSGDEYDCDDPSDGLPEPSPTGGMFGITGGYNWQNGNMVYGVAGDLMFGDLSDVVDDSTDPSYGCGTGCGLDVTGMAMLRGRVGYAMGDILPYATAGVAITRAVAFEPGLSRVEDTFTNAVIGAGVDYMISDTITAGFDVLHLIERADPIINSDFCGGCGPTNFSATMARVTIAYRF